MNKLNQRQEAIYKFLIEFKKEKQYSPSVREIRDALNIKSTSTVHNDLKKLEDFGLIIKSGNVSRTIEIVSKHDDKPSEDLNREETIDIPVYGYVAAGEPIFADDNVLEMFPIPSFYSSKGEMFMLTIKGESMIEAGILDGDKILVRKQNTCENGDIIVALIEDGATVKRYFKENNRVELRPENSSMAPIVADYFEVLGKVIALYRDHI
ncbi:MAG: transcriptional repressor LexA [Tissierellia bacterium]|nr:transcriptional repressor LexA [Tissierellia bacterium]